MHPGVDGPRVTFRRPRPLSLGQPAAGRVCSVLSGRHFSQLSLAVTAATRPVTQQPQWLAQSAGWIEGGRAGRCLEAPDGPRPRGQRRLLASEALRLSDVEGDRRSRGSAPIIGGRDAMF